MCVNFQNKWIKWWRLQKTQWKIHLRDWQAKARLWTWSKTIEPVPVGCFGLVSTGVSAADAFLVLIIITDLQGILQPPHILRGQAHGSPAILYLQIHFKKTPLLKKIVSQKEFLANLEILFEPKNDIIPSFKPAVWRCHWEKNNLFQRKRVLVPISW